jgi:hypothetical protein
MMKKTLSSFFSRNITLSVARTFSSKSATPATPAAPAAPAAPTDSLHSTDIAFKPNADGWGATKKFSKNHQRIFGKKTKKTTGATTTTTLTFKTRQ